MLREILAKPPSATSLNRALRVLAKWRSEMLADAIARRSGGQVLSGPFRGMHYVARASEGARAPRIVGAYETSLVPVLEGIIASAPEVILDIGCAEGYYAVGLARRMPGARVIARDADPAAQEMCRAMATANGVTVEVGGLLTGPDFDICTRARSVVICDIEGAEDAVLDPATAPGLNRADILVEVHEAMRPGLTNRLAARFAATHRITRLDRRLDDSGLPDWMQGLSDMDRLLALWEWRSGPTPWLWMQVK
ncbi:hypothetical protein MASR2M74_07830 [Paracoccaceae bacterium]